MARFRLASLLWVNVVLGASVGVAHADDGSVLPCNSLCQRWLKIGQDDPPPPSPPAAPTDLVPPLVTSQATRPATPLRSVPAVQPVAVAKDLRPREVRPRFIAAELKPAQRPIPLPPRRTRTADAVLVMPVAPAAPQELLTLKVQPPALTPFGALPSPDRVAQAIAALPVPPTVSQDASATILATATEAVPAHKAAEGAAEPLVEPSATAVLASTPAEPEHANAPAIQVAAVIPAAALPQAPPEPVGRRSDAVWPPPIDVIGALLAAGAPVKPSP